MNFVFFLSFTEGEQWICRTFSDIGKRQFNVEFLSHSPFRKINSERMFFCRDSFKCLEKSKYLCPIAVFFRNFPPPLTFEDNSFIFIIERSNVWIRHLLVCSNSSNCRFSEQITVNIYTLFDAKILQVAWYYSMARECRWGTIEGVELYN